MGILLLTFTVLAVAVIALAALVIVGFPVRVTPGVIERALAVKLPVKKPLKWAGELQIPSIHLDSPEGERLAVRIDVAVTGLPAAGSISGKVDVSAVIRWDDAAGEMFLGQTKLERLSVDGLPDPFLAPMREAVTVAVREVLEAHPVWRLESRTKALGATRALIRDVRIRGGCLELRVGGSTEALVQFGRALLGRPPGQ